MQSPVIQDIAAEPADGEAALRAKEKPAEGCGGRPNSRVRSRNRRRGDDAR